MPLEIQVDTLRTETDRSLLRRRLLALTWPVVAEYALQVVSGMVDMMMVGRLGRVAVAAVGVCYYPLFFSVSVFLGVAVGVTALISRLTGARDDAAVVVATRQAFWLAATPATLVGVGYGLAAPSIVAAMGADASVAPVATDFLRWSALGAVAFLWTQVMNAAVRGGGDTRTPLVIGAGVSVTNFVLGYVLIFGQLGLPALGVRGSAIASSAARVVGALALLIVLLSRNTPVHLRVSTIGRIDGPLLWRLLKVGLPSAGERALQTLGMTSFTSVVVGLGTTALAAHQLTLTAESVSFTPAFAMGIATSVIVGQQLGAADARGAQVAASESIRWALAMMLGFSLIFWFLGAWYLRLFTGDQEVLELGAAMLKIAAVSQPVMGLAYVVNGVLRGAGDTLTPMVSTPVGIWVIRMSVVLVLIHAWGWGLEAAWFAMVFDWGTRSAIGLWRFQTGRWRLVRI